MVAFKALECIIKIMEKDMMENLEMINMMEKGKHFIYFRFCRF